MAKLQYKQQAIACAINYWLSTDKAIIGRHAHHLYDFLVEQKIISPEPQQIKDQYAAAKEVELNRWLEYKDTMSPEAYQYNVNMINENKSVIVIQRAKVAVLQLIMLKTPIDLEAVKQML